MKQFEQVPKSGKPMPLLLIGTQLGNQGSIRSTEFYDSLEQSQGDLINLAEGDLMEIAQDGEHDGVRTRRKFLAGALAFAVNPDDLRIEFGNPSGVERAKRGSETVADYLRVAASAGESHRTKAGNGLIIREITVPDGEFSRSIIQGFAYDQNAGELYTLRTTSGDAGVNETCTVEVYENSRQITTDRKLASNPTSILGHQGLGVQRKNGVVWLWGTGGTSSIPERGRTIVKCTLNRTSLNIESEVKYRVFGNDFVADGSRCAAISPNHQIVVATATRRDGAWICRVFSEDDLQAAGDYSKKFISQFEFAKYGYPVQAIATDGEAIFILHGDGSNNSPKILEAYDMAGQLLSLDKDFQIGRNDAVLIKQAGGSYYYEPEALAMLPSMNGWQLAACVAAGRRAGSNRHVNVIARTTLDIPPKSA